MIQVLTQQEALTLLGLAYHGGVNHLPKPDYICAARCFYLPTSLSSWDYGKQTIEDPKTSILVYNLQTALDYKGIPKSKQWLLPPYDIACNKHRMWTKENLDACEIKLFQKPKVKTISTKAIHLGFYNQANAANYLGITTDRLTKLQALGLIPEPKQPYKTRLYYSLADLKKIKAAKAKWAAAYAAKRSNKYHDKTAAELGLYSQTKFAEVVNIPRITLASWLNQGVFYRPSNVGPGAILYYNDADVENLKTLKADYFASQHRTFTRY